VRLERSTLSIRVKTATQERNLNEQVSTSRIKMDFGLYKMNPCKFKIHQVLRGPEHLILVDLFWNCLRVFRIFE
jgi:hypothetical protein